MSSDKWDYESRLDTTTRTDNGSYDQVVALSQGLINDNFQKLYDLYPQLRNFEFSDKIVGDFKGELLAPQILVPGADKGAFSLGSVFFQFRFKSGSLKTPDGGINLDLADWMFTIPVPINSENIEDEEKRRQIKERFDYPGDYSIERLYMDLSVADWDKLDNRLSVAKDENGHTVSYLQWRAKHDMAAVRLQAWLGELMLRIHKDSVNSLGLTFKSPPHAEDDATFAPQSLTNQVYHYKSARNGCPNGQTSIGGAGDCNCLLYLEMVKGGGQKPAEPRLLWSGNFATQPRSRDDKGIRGTYLLSRKLFMEKLVLPEFRALNRASEIYHKPPYFDKAGVHSQKFGIILEWDTGHDPNIATDSGGEYDFKPVSDPNNRLNVTSYEWSKTNSQSPPAEKMPSHSFWGKASTEDTMTTTVTWTPGSDEIVLTGNTTSKENCFWSTIKDNFDNSAIYLRDVYTIQWSLKVRIIPKPPVSDKGKRTSSALLLQVDHEPSSISVTLKSDQRNVDMHGHDQKLKEALEARMKEQLSRVLGNIQKALDVTGRFTYPGNGILVFERVVVGTYGDLNAEIHYEELKPNEWIEVPKKRENDPEGSIDPDPNTNRPTPTRTAHELTWTATPSFLHALGEKPQTLKIRGTNNAENPFRFGSFIFMFKTGPRSGCLFTDGKYVFEEGEATPGSEPPEDTGEIRLSQSANQPKCKVVVTEGANEHGVVPWKVTVTADDGGALKLPPKAWIEVAVTAMVGPGEMHQFYIDEAYQTEAGEKDGDFNKPLEIRVS